MTEARSSSMTVEAPCCWQSETALTKICSLQRNSSGPMAVYVGLTRLVNARREPRFTATQSEIATYSGTSDRSVREWLPVLKELGVIDIRERFEGKNRLADEITLLSMAPPEEASAPPEVLSAPPEELGSDCRHNSSELLRRIEEPKNRRSTRSKASAITHEAIYKAYPRKVGKQKALKAIAKACQAIDPDDLLGRVEAYAGAVSEWPMEDHKFIPYPATWFNHGRYEDHPSEWQRGGSQSKVAPFSVAAGRAL